MQFVFYQRFIYQFRRQIFAQLARVQQTFFKLRMIHLAYFFLFFVAVDDELNEYDEWSQHGVRYSEYILYEVRYFSVICLRLLTQYS